MQKVDSSDEIREKRGFIRSIQLKLGLSSESLTRRYILVLLLIAPAFILRIVTAAYPILQTIQLGFTSTDLINGKNDFIGLGNYQAMLTDYGVQGALSFTVLLVVVLSILDLVVGIMIALLLNSAFRGRGFARAINLIPWAIPNIVVGYMFRWLLDDQFGLFTTWIYQFTGIRLLAFTDVLWARIVVISAYVWKDAPFIAVIILAGLQGVPEELYDAAKIDGANAWNRFWAITFPLIMPLTITMGLFRLLWSMGNFDLVFGVSQGGPGVATSVLALQIFRTGILFFKFGMASAISVVLLLFAAIIGLIGLWLFRKTDVSY